MIYLVSAYALLQDLALCRLGVSKVHHLIEQLIQNNEIVTNRLLLELLKVLLKYTSQLVQKENNLCSITVTARKREYLR